MPTFSGPGSAGLKSLFPGTPVPLLASWVLAYRAFLDLLAPGDPALDSAWAEGDAPPARLGHVEDSGTAAQDQLQLLGRALEIVREGVVIVRNGRVHSVNEAFVSITGYPREEAVGREADFLYSSDAERPGYYIRRYLLTIRGYWQGELWGRRKNGDLYPAWTAITRVDRPDGCYFVSVFSDISLRKKSVERLEYLTHHDLLTDLPNRAFFYRRLSDMLGRAARLSSRVGVLFVDIDHFKLINDSLGHDGGDEILGLIGARLKAMVREGDIVARFGGDEFAILMDELRDTEEAAGFAQTVLAAFTEPVCVAGHSIFLTGSVGISCYPAHGRDAGELINNAHAAMYRAKYDGRNTCCVFSPEMNAHAGRKLSLRNGLREAIARGELMLEYQPRVCLRTGSVLGLEALVRWQHSEHGLMLPGSFIGLAEETGLIEPLGEWVLQSACRQMKKWIDAGMDLTFVSVNLSPRQFRQRGLSERICGILRAANLPPSSLELEITEGMVMDNPAAAEKVLNELTQAGICLSLDDFGTGYSSLAYLKRFPIRHLKIDRSFVEELPGNSEAVAITRAILALAKSLRISVTAEGIERAEQAGFLRDEGCDCGQGYLFGRPAPPHHWNDLGPGSQAFPALLAGRPGAP